MLNPHFIDILNIYDLVYWVLWHINYFRLSNGKSSLYRYIKYIWFGLVGSYSLSTILGYLMPNPFYTYILNTYDLVWLGFMAYQQLTPPQRAVHLVMFKISVGRDLQNSTACLNGRKPKSIFQRSKSNWSLFKILKFSWPFHDVINTPAPFPVWVFIMTMVIVISFVCERILRQLTMHRDWDPNGSKPYQTER